jgi:hypothetical protein
MKLKRKITFNYCLEKTELEFLNNLWGLGTEEE